MPENPVDLFLLHEPNVRRLVAENGPAAAGSYQLVWSGGEGQRIIYYPSDDLWLYYAPAVFWRRVYIGQDEAFNREVLEEKFGCRKLFDAVIYNELRAVYIEE